MRRFPSLCLLLVLGSCGEPGPLPAPPGVTLAITDVSVVPMDREGVLRDRTVLVEGDRIVAVTAERFELGPSVRVVDGTGKYLLPGLWDMHVHALSQAEAFFPLFLAHGVTGVRDMGGHLDSLAAVRERLGTGALMGPRLVAAGPILDGPGHAWSLPFFRHLETPDEARSAVAELAAAGVDFLKVYSGLSPEVYSALTEAAGEHGLSFAGHVPFAVPAATASARGQASLEHADPGVVTLDCVEGGSARLRAALGAWGAEGYGAYLRHLTELRADRDPGCVQGLYEGFRAGGTRVVPTIVNTVKDSAAVNFEAVALLGEPDRRACTNTLALFHEAPDEVRARHHAGFLEDVGLLHRAGIPLLAGTDVPNACLVPGASLHDELARLVEVGLTPYEALQAATVRAAELLGMADRFGTVEPGKTADLVLVEGDPLDDIGAARRVSGVVLGGRYLAPDELLSPRPGSGAARPPPASDALSSPLTRTAKTPTTRK